MKQLTKGVLLFVRGVVSSSKVDDELLGLGVRIIEVTLAKVCNCIHTSRLTLERLMNEPVLSKFVSQSSRDLPSRRRIVSMRSP